MSKKLSISKTSTPKTSNQQSDSTTTTTTTTSNAISESDTQENNNNTDLTERNTDLTERNTDLTERNTLLDNVLDLSREIQSNANFVDQQHQVILHPEMFTGNQVCQTLSAIFAVLDNTKKMKQRAKTLLAETKRGKKRARRN
jgi:urease gamma subunit